MDQEPIDVIWLSYHEPEVIARGYWDQGLLEDLFKRGDFAHHKNFASDTNPDGYQPKDKAGAVVVINGRTHKTDTDIEKINADIAKLRWVVFIETGDEEAVFKWEDIKHPLKRFWVMLPRMNRHNDVSFKIPNGYRPATHETLKEIGYQEKDQDWFFAGQVNHERREQCVHELKLFLEPERNLYPNGTLVTTDGFGKETLDYKSYLAEMARSKIVLCPSGIETPDNFRLYEALEAGCLPVVDAFATKNRDWGFWNYLFNGDIPFPIVPYWDDLPKLMPTILREYSANASRAFAWWQLYKRNMLNKLSNDIAEVSK